MFAIGRFSDDVGVPEEREVREALGVALLFFAALVTLLGRTISVVVFVLPDGGFPNRFFFFLELSSVTWPAREVPVRDPGGLPLFFLISVGISPIIGLSSSASSSIGPNLSAIGTLFCTAASPVGGSISLSGSTSFRGPNLPERESRPEVRGDEGLGPNLSAIGVRSLGSTSSSSTDLISFVSRELAIRAILCALFSRIPCSSACLSLSFRAALSDGSALIV